MQHRNNKIFTLSSIALIESVSMRDWALGTHNLPIIIKMASTYKGSRQNFATYLTSVAMG